MVIHDVYHLHDDVFNGGHCVVQCEYHQHGVFHLRGDHYVARSEYRHYDDFNDGHHVANCEYHQCDVHHLRDEYHLYDEQYGQRGVIMDVDDSHDRLDEMLHLFGVLHLHKQSRKL